MYICHLYLAVLCVYHLSLCIFLSAIPIHHLLVSTYLSRVSISLFGTAICPLHPVGLSTHLPVICRHACLYHPYLPIRSVHLRERWLAWDLGDMGFQRRVNRGGTVNLVGGLRGWAPAELRWGWGGTGRQRCRHQQVSCGWWWGKDQEQGLPLRRSSGAGCKRLRRGAGAPGE